MGDEAIALPPQPAALCAFLILNRQRRITREEIQAAFWPDAAPARVQERLRRALYLLRQALQPYPHLIAAEGSEIAIAPDAAVWVDYEEFEKAALDAYRTDPPDTGPLERLVSLYKDDLLKDVYADWVVFDREHARQRFLTALRHLMMLYRQSGNWSAVIRHAHTLLAQDPLQEIAHQALMKAYSATGDRSAAIRQYQQCVQVLDEELGAEPLPETIQLYEDILHNRVTVELDFTPPAALPAFRSLTDLQAVPLVGRETELAEIASEWQICQAGNSRLVLITGPAGMGKTRLVEEAVSRIPGSGVTVLTGNCYAIEAGTPYQLISDLLRGAIEGVADRLPPIMQADLAQLVPALQGGRSTRPTAPPAGATETTVRLQEAITQVIRLLASAERGLWLVAEDLHWADPASLACLNHALRRCGDLPLMVLATLRDEEVSYDSPLMDWPRRSVHAPAPTTVIRLRPLPPDDLQQLLDQVVAEDAGMILSQLYRETAGNPFFVVETLRALAEQGAVYRAPGGRWRLREEAVSRLASLPVTEAVLDMIRQRTRRLSRHTQAVLAAAAVIEHDIDERLLAQVVDGPESLDLALDELLTASILEEASPGLYQFTHLKVREIVYADISAPRCRFLHRRVADTLSEHVHNPILAHISRLAYHYAQARAWTHALIHHWRAARTAQSAGAMAEANRYADLAQGILDEHAAEIERERLPENLAAIRFDLLSLRAEFRRQAATAGLYYPPGMIAEIETLLPEVNESRRAQASLQQAMHRLGQGDLTGAREAAEQGRALYAGQDDLWGELNAAQHQTEIAYRAGDLVRMWQLLDEMRALSAAIDQPGARQTVAYNEMRLATYEGDWTTVLRLAQELSSSQQARSDPAVAWLPLANLGLAYMKLGAYDEAYTVAQQAVAASEEAHILGLGARVLLARLELWHGNRTQARTILLDILETPNPLIGQVEVVSPALALVRCYVADNDDENARRWARRAAQAAVQVGLPILYPMAQVAGALTDVAAGRYEDARKSMLYPLEYLLLLEDTSPQEIFALRAAAARGLGDDAAARDWLDLAWNTVEEQAERLDDEAYRETFLKRVPLHVFIAHARTTDDWQPLDLIIAGQSSPS